MSNMMSVNGLSVGLHLTTALASRSNSDGREVAQGLPPCGPTDVFNLAEYPDAPDEWVRANGPNEMTYFFGVPRTPERGIWFDFHPLNRDSHDVAVRVSMQGVDALTGIRSDDTKLHWYKHNCPRHGTPFNSKRYCEECGFTWPGTNFLSSSGSRNDGAAFWLDGFRNSDGEIRQAIFVDDPERGVAAQLIGDDRSPAFAFVMRRSVEPKPRPRFDDMFRGGMLESAPPLSFSPPLTRGMSKGPEVAAGALVNQRIGVDPNGPDYWAPEEFIIRLYFAWEDQLTEVLQNRRPVPGGSGFLKTLKVGNPLKDDLIF